MAEPVSEAARRLAAMSRRAADLAARQRTPDAVDARVRVETEERLGMRCGGCGKRIGVGLQFRRIEVVVGSDGRAYPDVMVLSACNGADGCDFAGRARQGADVIEMVEFVWLTGEAPVGAGGLAADVKRADRAAGGDAAE